MIYITLPNFYTNYKLLNFLKDLEINHKDLFNIDLTFNFASGNFPHNYWNGGYNNNHFTECTNYYAIDIVSAKSKLPLRINCTNINLEDEDFYDTLANTILQMCESETNCIEISNLNLYEYLKEKYPKYRFIFSKEANLYFTETPEIINTIIEQDIFTLIEVSEEHSADFKFLKQINNLDKIEVCLIGNCNITCPNYTECKRDAHLQQSIFAKRNLFLTCDKNKNTINPIILRDQIDKYINLGITHFKIDNAFKNPFQLLNYIANNFIKEEKIKDFYNLFIYNNWKEN